MDSSMVKHLFILGNHVQSLELARQAKLHGLQVSLFSDYHLPISRFSNACQRFFVFDSDVSLLELLNVQWKDNAILMATNDALVNFMAVHYNELSAKYKMGTPRPVATAACYNKKQTYLIARQIELAIPDSFFPESMEDIEDLSNKIKYPVLIKPAIMHKFHKQTGVKMFRCNNAMELKHYYQMACNVIPAEEVIVQDFISGGPSQLYSFGCFAIDGEIVAGFAANRVRQKPWDFGVATTFALTVKNEIIKQHSRSILKEMDYFGYAEVEFMFDSKTQTYKLIEINPRTWKWHGLARAAGLDFFKIMLDHFNGISSRPQMNYTEKLGWIEGVTDTFTVIKAILKGKYSIRNYVKTFQIKKVRAIFDKNDIRPFLAYLLLLPYLFVKRN
jgi:D-aspartate ligase